MSASPTFIVHHGQLGTEDDLEQSLGLREGQRLIVASSNGQEIILRRTEDSASAKKQDWMEAWRALRASVPNQWTPELQAKAENRRRLAIENLDRVYTDERSGATEMKQAERELEFANDELAGGPYLER